MTVMSVTAEHISPVRANATAATSIAFILALTAIIAFYANQQTALMAARMEAAAGEAMVDPRDKPYQHARQAREKIISERFEQAVVMLHAKKYEYAVTALHRVLELNPRLPEAHVNMGFALIGLKRFKEAQSFFESATNLRPYQRNAYWGLAVALENLGDLHAALGAMRTYIHLSPPDDAYVRKARAALWEWQDRLKRGPRPKQEARWLAERGKAWQDRNNAEVDLPEPEKLIDLFPGK
jgi:tetratricopeptide (TPR) repeat protein